HATAEIQSLADYRIRYGQYKADPDLRAAHAACPWLVTWDDHEVDNNYAGLSGENRMESEEQMRARRAAG
ncbi:alkaline phosphatase D family protein, partial [Salmonella enterica subsp. enterica serovar Minnesota]|uniref:alkaline phosphatase D family protein n=1 Tax=Salmonella enterica TaxID=28901 RepID=UPI003D2C72F3